MKISHIFKVFICIRTWKAKASTTQFQWREDGSANEQKCQEETSIIVISTIITQTPRTFCAGMRQIPATTTIDRNLIVRPGDHIKINYSLDNITKRKNKIHPAPNREHRRRCLRKWIRAVGFENVASKMRRNNYSFLLRLVKSREKSKHRHTISYVNRFNSNR